MWIRVCRYKNAGVAGYAEAFIPVQSDSQTSEWYSYFENAVLDHPRLLLTHERSRSATIYGNFSSGITVNFLQNYLLPQHFLYFLPLPHGHGSFG